MPKTEHSHWADRFNEQELNTWYLIDPNETCNLRFIHRNLAGEALKLKRAPAAEQIYYSDQRSPRKAQPKRNENRSVWEIIVQLKIKAIFL